MRRHSLRFDIKGRGKRQITEKNNLSFTSQEAPRRKITQHYWMKLSININRKIKRKNDVTVTSEQAPKEEKHGTTTTTTTLRGNVSAKGPECFATFYRSVKGKLSAASQFPPCNSGSHAGASLIENESIVLNTAKGRGGEGWEAGEGWIGGVN